MRVLHLLSTPVFSGPAENVLELALNQRAQGHEVTVAIDSKRGALGSEEAAAPRFGEAGLLNIDLGLELSTRSSLYGIGSDARKLRRRSVDVVHAHMSHDHWVARWARPRASVLIRSVHAPRSLGWTMPRADAFTVPTCAHLDRVNAPAIVLPPLLSVAYRSSDDRDALRRSLGVNGSPLIGMVSTFQASRRHDLALEAFARLRQVDPDARLVLVGDGVEEARLRARVAQADLSGAVTFAGYCSGPAFIRWLQAFDQVWILGLGNDWSGRAAAQARACGAIVLAVAEGALPEWADATFPPDPSAIAERARAPARSVRALPRAEHVAAEVTALYARAREGA